MEVARALQNSLSTNEVLITVVDAALSVTGCDRGFLMLRRGDGAGRRGGPRPRRQASPQDELRVPPP